MNSTILHQIASVIFTVLIMALLAFAIFIACAKARKFRKVWRALDGLKMSFESRLLIAANSILPEYMGNHTRSFTGDASITARYMLVKAGASAGTIACIAAASDKPLGVCIDQYDAGNPTIPLTVVIFGAHRGLIPAAISAALNEGQGAYSDGAGGVCAEPTAAGLFWRVGLAATKETVVGQFIALAPTLAVPVAVFAELTTITTPDGSSAGTTQTLANAIQADFITLRAGLAVPAEIKML